MKRNSKAATFFTKVFVKVAKITAGQISIAGTYQPKEPEVLKKILKK